jgi:parallel beta-helix repeat protein
MNKKCLFNKPIIIIFVLFAIFGSILPSTLGIKQEIIDDNICYLNNNNILYVGGIGPGNISKIQNAINAADNGYTIFVYNGTYEEQISIDKSLKILGENRETTIIDAGGDGDGVNITADNVHFINFTVRNTGIGNSLDVLKNAAIRITLSNNNKIQNVICHDTNYGLWTDFSDDNIIIDNVFHGFYDGISLAFSKNNYLRNNSVINSGLVLGGFCISKLIHDIDTSNTANGKPVYYYKNETSIKVPSNAGEVILVNCSNFTISDLEISNVTDGIELLFSNYNIIKNNIITNATDFAIRLQKSNYNIIKNNNCSNNAIGIGFNTAGFDGYKRNADCNYNIVENNSLFFNEYFGIILTMSNYNEISKNNFIGNKIDNARFVRSFKNKWSNNYWDDWVGLKINLFRCFPKLIPGSLIKELYWMNIWANFDWHPALKPYET